MMGAPSRRDAVAGLALLVLAGCATRLSAPAAVTMPVDLNATATPDLVDVAVHVPGSRLDVRYATANNFMHRPLYPVARVLLQRPAADALRVVQARAQERGQGLLLFDGYRPWSITKAMWDETPPAQRDYVADPASGSRHNRGCAIDLSLYDLASGREVEMPSPYDDFTTRAHRDFMDAPTHALESRERLQRWMTDAGFVGLANEWWHFDWADWRRYPIMDAPLTAG